jgi:hypothetical protein
MPSRALTELRIESDGQWTVAEIVEFLEAFRGAHDGLVIFESLLELYAAHSEWRRYRSFPDVVVYGASGILSATLELSDDALNRFVRPEQQLVVQSVQLASPGFWEFVGSLNPLEVLRRYLDDRHRHRQDREYREAHESRRLDLENMVLENRVLNERIAIARELGLPEVTVTAMLGRWVAEPLRRIDSVYDRGMILPPAEPDAEQEPG